jgi:hypothetical protein
MGSPAGRSFLTFFTAMAICAVTVCLGTAALVHIVRSCHDTDASSNVSINVLLWPVVTPILWLGETAVLGAMFVVCRRFVTRRWAQGVVGVLFVLAVVGPLTWWYLSFGVSGLSTGLYSADCPHGAPAWWPSWLSLYDPD